MILYTKKLKQTNGVSWWMPIINGKTWYSGYGITRRWAILSIYKFPAQKLLKPETVPFNCIYGIFCGRINRQSCYLKNNLLLLLNTFVHYFIEQKNAGSVDSNFYKVSKRWNIVGTNQYVFINCQLICSFSKFKHLVYLVRIIHKISSTGRRYRDWVVTRKLSICISLKNGLPATNGILQSLPITNNHPPW